MRWRSELLSELVAWLVGRSVGLGQGQYGSTVLRLDSNFDVSGMFCFIYKRFCIYKFYEFYS